MPCTVLLVDDEETIRTSVEMYLRDRDYDVHTAATVDEGLEKLDTHLPDVLLADLNMPGKDGFHLIREALKRSSATAVIVISGHGDIEKAVRATKLGAHQFIEKPVRLTELEEAIRDAVGRDTTRRHLVKVENEGVRIEGAGWTMLGVSDAMMEVYRMIRMLSQSAQSTVLIQGESGVGKEVVARAIYECTPRNNSSDFVDVNCAALSESLLEAELFGHEKGAFTGAVQSREGLFGAAHGGTIFLDEIGEMPLKLQAKFLRVLEERSFKRVGGTENVPVECRVIASTNRDLAEMVQEGEFRKDLFYRLDVFNIRVPALRKRPRDIPVLAAHFLEQLARTCNKHISGFTPNAMSRLKSYDWPGNVRELRNVIERAVILGSGSTIDEAQLMLGRHGSAAEPEPESAAELPVQSLEEMEKQLIVRVLDETGWQKTRSAEILGINRTTLWQKIKRYELEEPS